MNISVAITGKAGKKKGHESFGFSDDSGLSLRLYTSAQMESETTRLEISIHNIEGAFYTYYTYLIPNKVAEILTEEDKRIGERHGRPGSFLGLTIRTKNVYSRNIVEIYRLLDDMYKKYLYGSILTDENTDGFLTFVIEEINEANSQLDLIREGVDKALKESASHFFEIPRDAKCSVMGSIHKEYNLVDSKDKSLFDSLFSGNVIYVSRDYKSFAEEEEERKKNEVEKKLKAEEEARKKALEQTQLKAKEENVGLEGEDVVIIPSKRKDIPTDNSVGTPASSTQEIAELKQIIDKLNEQIKNYEIQHNEDIVQIQYLKDQLHETRYSVEEGWNSKKSILISVAVLAVLFFFFIRQFIPTAIDDEEKTTIVKNVEGNRGSSALVNDSVVKIEVDIQQKIEKYRYKGDRWILSSPRLPNHNDNVIGKLSAQEEFYLVSKKDKFWKIRTQENEEQEKWIYIHDTSKIEKVN